MFEIKRNLKMKILAVSLIALFAISIISMASMTSAQVGVPQPEKTSGYIDIAPHLIGVGQNATVNLFIYPIPTDNAYLGYYTGYSGVTVTFVKPDGTKDTFMPKDGTGLYAPGQTQALGAIYFFYAPNMAGNWSVSFTMPDQNLTDTTGTVLMSGCTSGTTYFTVQTDPVLAGLLNGYPWSSLPNSNAYWNYPINSNNREWSQIAGDWLGTGSTGATILGDSCRLWQPYGSGPNTAHIVWDTPIRPGGIVGGDYGSISYDCQSTAPTPSITTLIMDGKVFVNIYNTNTFQCIDLATGKILYTATGQVSMGYHVPGNGGQQSTASPQGNVDLHSSFGNAIAPELFAVSGSTWNYYDALTGTLVQSIVNASGSPYIVDGSPLSYVITGTAPNRSLVCWNMTKLNTAAAGSLSAVTSTNWPLGIQWTRPLPVSTVSQLPQITTEYHSSGLTTSVYGISSDMSTIVVRFAPNQYGGYSAATGASIWNLTLNYPAQQNQEICLYPVNDLIIFDPTNIAFKCYSMITGNLLWTSTSFNDKPFATTWTVYWGETADNNNLYALLPDGTVRAYSLSDGHEVWRSTAIPSTEFPNNALPGVQNIVMEGGKLYAYLGYSAMYQLDPIPRFGMLECINATNGDTIFTANGGLRVSSAANGYVIAGGDYDGNLYGLGKGTTLTSVTAQQQVGGSVLIQGSVFDKSLASSDAAVVAKYPDGVPAISDADMTTWMDYLHMQNATLLNNPPNCNGVPVTLTAVDPNGNAINIGTTTSNGGGHFAYQWNPTTAGLYTIYATFGGTDSYFSSYAQSSALVASASSSSPAPNSTEQSSVSNSDMLIYFAIGVVVIILSVAIATVLILRKRA